MTLGTDSFLALDRELPMSWGKDTNVHAGHIDGHVPSSS